MSQPRSLHTAVRYCHRCGEQLPGASCCQPCVLKMRERMARVDPYGEALALRDFVPEPELPPNWLLELTDIFIKEANSKTGGCAGSCWSDPSFENAVRILEDGQE